MSSPTSVKQEQNESASWDPTLAVTPHAESSNSVRLRVEKLGRAPWVYWGSVGALAILAYCTVLRVGFLADDFVLLMAAKVRPYTWATLLPDPTWFFYRPLGNLFIWQIGSILWGDNPLPYHIFILLAHAACAMMLAFLVAKVSRRPALGRLTGAIWGVLPLHMETAGWLAGGWNVMSALFGLSSLLAFAHWADLPERASRRSLLYVSALLLYTASIFTMENMLAVLLILPFLMLAVKPPSQVKETGWKLWLYYLLPTVPFAAVVALNLGLRFATWGNLGGYGATGVHFADSFWDQLLSYVHMLLGPVNAKLLGYPTQQAVGLLSMSLILAGLVAYGRVLKRELGLSVLWIGVTLAPVLNLAANPIDLEQARYLYVPAMGYALILASLISSAYQAGAKERRLGTAVAVAVLAGSIGLSWLQLRPWHTATVLADAVGGQIQAIMPPLENKNGAVWYIANQPDNYEGAYVLRIGMDGQNYLSTGKQVLLQNVSDTSKALLDKPTIPYSDAFAFNFGYSISSVRFNILQVGGITMDRPPPTVGQPGSSQFHVWNFGSCASAELSAWQAAQAKLTCEPGAGLVITPQANDPQLVGPEITFSLPANHFLRLAVQAKYEQGAQPQAAPLRMQLYWATPGAQWDKDASVTLPTNGDGQSHVYWLYIPAIDAGPTVTRLRLDPVNSNVPTRIGWISADVVGTP